MHFDRRLGSANDRRHSLHGSALFSDSTDTLAERERVAHRVRIVRGVFEADVGFLCGYFPKIKFVVA